MIIEVWNRRYIDMIWNQYHWTPSPAVSFLPEVEGSSVYTFSVCFFVSMFDYNIFTTQEQPFASSATSVCLGFVHLISCTLILLNLLQSEQAPMYERLTWSGQLSHSKGRK